MNSRHGGTKTWTSKMSGSIPRTTASLLRVDYVHRAKNPLDPKLRAEMRWVAAHANHCTYAEEYAVAEMLERTAAPGWVVLDIGAHVGIFTLALASSVGPQTWVISASAERRAMTAAGKW